MDCPLAVEERASRLVMTGITSDLIAADGAEELPRADSSMRE